MASSHITGRWLGFFVGGIILQVLGKIILGPFASPLVLIIGVAVFLYSNRMNDRMKEELERVKQVRRATIEEMSRAQAAQVEASMIGLRHSVHHPAPRAASMYSCGSESSSSSSYHGSSSSTTNTLRHRGPSSRRPCMSIGSKKAPMTFSDCMQSSSRSMGTRSCGSNIDSTGVIKGLDPDWRLHHRPLTHKVLDQVMRCQGGEKGFLQQKKAAPRQLQQPSAPAETAAAAATEASPPAGSVDPAYKTRAIYQGRRRRIPVDHRPSHTLRNSSSSPDSESIDPTNDMDDNGISAAAESSVRLPPAAAVAQI